MPGVMVAPPPSRPEPGQALDRLPGVIIIAPRQRVSFHCFRPGLIQLRQERGRSASAVILGCPLRLKRTSAVRSARGGKNMVRRVGEGLVDRSMVLL
jgi:hypothetical protein